MIPTEQELELATRIFTSYGILAIPGGLALLLARDAAGMDIDIEDLLVAHRAMKQTENYRAWKARVPHGPASVVGTVNACYWGKADVARTCQYVC